jgi:uncharacterized protein with GYD domain
MKPWMRFVKLADVTDKAIQTICGKRAHRAAVKTIFHVGLERYG